MNKPVLNILTYVLDDDEVVLMLIEKAFENAGIKDFKLFTKSNDLLNEEMVPHIAIIDYMLKEEGINGLDVTKILLKKNPNCYVIIMSGQDNWEVLKGFMNSGARYYVEKKNNYLAEVAEQVNEAARKLKMDLDFYTMLFEKYNERDDKNDKKKK
jgi:DNA-binding NtrC family response regulator